MLQGRLNVMAFVATGTAHALRGTPCFGKVTLGITDYFQIKKKKIQIGFEHPKMNAFSFSPPYEQNFSVVLQKSPAALCVCIMTSHQSPHR